MYGREKEIKNPKPRQKQNARFGQKIGTKDWDKRLGQKDPDKKVRAKRIGHKCKCRTGGKKIETIIEEFGQVVTGMLMVNGSLSLVGIVLIKLLKVL